MSLSALCVVRVRAGWNQHDGRLSCKFVDEGNFWWSAMSSEKRTMRLLLVCALGTLAGSYAHPLVSSLYYILVFLRIVAVRLMLLCTRLRPLEPFSAPL